MSSIVSIVYKPEHLPSKPADHYSRIPLQSATLVANYGIEGDTKGGHPQRQLNLMSFETLQALSSEGFNVEPGQMGEQIVMQGVDVNALSAGDRMQIGDGAVIEVTVPRTGCDRFEALQSKLRTDASGRMGVMARVISGGVIRVGDKVKVLQHV